MVTTLRSLETLTATEIMLTDAVQAHLRLISINKSEKTKAHYRYTLQRFVSDIGNRPLSDIYDADLLDWYAELSDRSLSPFTFHAYVTVVKRFFTWLYNRQILPADLATGLQLPALPRGNRKGIADSHAQAILDLARSNARDYAILTFIDSTACRRSGLAGLRLADIQPDAPLPACRVAYVREKGHPERPVMLNDEALAAMRAWLAVRPAIGDDHVFFGQSPGKPWKPLQPESIRAMIIRYAARLGIEGPVSPHQWRHRTSRRRIRQGMPFKTVAQLNGHSVQVCERYYSDLTEGDLIEQFERAERK